MIVWRAQQDEEGVYRSVHEPQIGRRIPIERRWLVG